MITTHVLVSVITVIDNIYNSIYLAHNIIFEPGKYVSNYDFNLIFKGMCTVMSREAVSWKGATFP